MCLGTKVSAAADWIYTVRPGDNLWNLSEEYLINVSYTSRLQALNRVQDPYQIPPGTKLRFPIAWLKLQQAPARAVTVMGDASYLTASVNQPQALKAGQELMSGDQVRTGPDANIVLEFADGSRFNLRENSILHFDTISIYGKTGMVDTRLRLENGGFDATVRSERGPGTRYVIETPAAVAGIRGTDYRLGADAEERAMRAEVLKGRIAVTAKGRTRAVDKGFGTLAKQGEPPLPPRKLLPPPNLEELSAPLRRSPVRLAWPPVPGAVAYRVQFAANQRFDVLLYDRISQTDQANGPDVPDGDYFLRIRAIDKLGLEGLDAVRGVTVDARPEPPFQIAPKAAEIVRTDNATLSWAKVEQARSYQVQIARDETFHTLAVNRLALTGTEFSPDPALVPGDYFWRIATRSQSGELGPFSDAIRFTLRPTPVAQAPTIEKDTFTIQWPAGLPGERYRFQFSKDERFTLIVADRRLSESSITLPRPIAGAYFMRLAVIGDDGVQGPYGATQRIDIPLDSYWPSALMMTLFSLMFAL
ncbi:MAG: FecR domain-containing protein [Gammaproteobacteria bacterium]